MLKCTLYELKRQYDIVGQTRTFVWYSYY